MDLIVKTGADLSKLDLRCINFKYAKLKGCQLHGANLSKCNMERADLSNAHLDGAQLLGVRMVCSNLEKASLQNCNFEDPAGSIALMEGKLQIDFLKRGIHKSSHP